MSISSWTPTVKRLSTSGREIVNASTNTNPKLGAVAPLRDATE
jgi:hypothetical protein